MSKGIKRKINKALERVHSEIKGYILGKDGEDLFYAGGLAGEGYAGGYRDALYDILLALNGIRPNRRDYWANWEE